MRNGGTFIEHPIIVIVDSFGRIIFKLNIHGNDAAVKVVVSVDRNSAEKGSNN
jgi:hypothetical protein